MASTPVASIFRQAVVDCSQRGLIFAAKWAAELITTGLASANQTCSVPTLNDTTTLGQSLGTPVTCDRFLLAKTYFDLREFHRTIFVLQACTGSPCRFLRNYARFMAGEQVQQDQDVHSLGTSLSLHPGARPSPNKDVDYHADGPRKGAMNQELPLILEDFQVVEQDQLDGFELYLLGLVYHRQGLKTQAVDTLIQAVHRYPYNWSAWLELGTCVESLQTLDNSVVARLPDSFMTQFFLTHLRLEFHGSPRSVNQSTTALKQQFPDCGHLLTLQAMAHYHAREFEEAEALFDTLFRADPFRLDHIDVYSNILYVMENRPKLSYLAHHCVEIDKYRPETCCVIGNYYGLRGEHEKAIVYFQRALKLDRQYLSAWTLMGHEYVELKNTSAAIEAYRRAIDIDERDHRAWSGLGQIYEFLKMPHYALFYYQRAAALRPFDTRLWSVLAGCYELCQRYEEAIQCYNRALLEAENETLLLTQLAKLYTTMDRPDDAAEHYRLALKSYPVDEAKSDEYLDACLFLAQYEKKQCNFSAASRYLHLIIDHGGDNLEEARALLREIQSELGAQLRMREFRVQ
ncbi:Anaphase-promoting complex subunit 8 [Dispira simplex]|nr:Anaphase-promoting complex subunit 8 [Dispira simplex]